MGFTDLVMAYAKCLNWLYQATSTTAQCIHQIQTLPKVTTYTRKLSNQLPITNLLIQLTILTKIKA